MQINFNKKLVFLLISLVLFIGLVNAQKDTLKLNKQLNDSLNPAEMQEESFQDFLDTLVDMDMSNWNNKMINIRSFDPAKMTDTVHFRLFDSLRNEHFIPPFKNYITSPFGPRRRIYHYGMDIKLQSGDTVRAAFDGIVRVTKYDRRGYGNAIVIRHILGLETVYGHLSKVLVEPNQRVKAGDLIGLGGNTGRSTGSHLHFETRYNGEPFNPSCFYDFQSQKLICDTLILTRTNFNYLIELRKAKYCTIKKGDNLGRIAMRYHTSVKKLCKLNGISTKTILRIGRKLRYQ